MGLDQYAYWREDGDDDRDHDQELAYWRKHHPLQEWMGNLWDSKRIAQEADKSIEDKFIDALDEQEEYTSFNCVELELDECDLDSLENDIEDGCMGEDPYYENGDEADSYKPRDMKFIEDARKLLAEGKKVFYNSWW